MESKDIAKMLFKMHLKERKDTRSYAQLVNDYSSNIFLEGIMFVGATDMTELERIAYAYPEAEFMMLLKDGNIAYFETDRTGMRCTHVIASELDKAEALGELDQPFEEWAKVDDIYFPRAEKIWMRYL